MGITDVLVQHQQYCRCCVTPWVRGRVLSLKLIGIAYTNNEAISLFKQKTCLYLDNEGITDKVKPARKICRGIRDEGLRRLNASGLSDDDKKKLSGLLFLFVLVSGFWFLVYDLHPCIMSCVMFFPCLVCHVFDFSMPSCVL